MHNSCKRGAAFDSRTQERSRLGPERYTNLCNEVKHSWLTGKMYQKMYQRCIKDTDAKIKESERQ